VFRSGIIDPANAVHKPPGLLHAVWVGACFLSRQKGVGQGRTIHDGSLHRSALTL
jgi:hypothetical protein